MIAKKYRLKRNEIEYVLKKGEELITGKFIIRYAKNTEKFSKYCVIISKKFDASAVKRNLLKRRVYEAVRRYDTFKENDLNVILIPKKSITKDTKFEDIQKEISAIIKKLNKKDGKI